MNKLSYWLDENNIISKVSETWDANMGHEDWSERASSKTIVGRPLLEFICDDTTRMYVTSILDLVRLVPQSLFRHYRCDSPDTKRFMKMTISPEENGLVRLTHELIRTEPLTKTVIFTPAKNYHKNNGYSSLYLEDKEKGQVYIRCSLCNQLSKEGNNNWQDADKFPEFNLLSTNISVSYGICPYCIKGMPASG